MNTAQFALASSIYTLGGLIGALCAGPLCNTRGRLLCMRLTALFFVIGPIFESLSSNIGLLVTGRFLSGIGAGAAIVVVPIYISELAPPRGKGFFGAFTQVMINLGILIAQLLGYFLSRDNLWRIILASAGGIGVLHFGGLFFVPESPKWLAEHDNPQHAKAILGRIRGHKVNLDAEVKAWNVDSNPEVICTRYSLFLCTTLLTYISGGRISPCRIARCSFNSKFKSVIQHGWNIWCHSSPHLSPGYLRRHHGDDCTAVDGNKQYCHVLGQHTLRASSHRRGSRNRRSKCFERCHFYFMYPSTRSDRTQTLPPPQYYRDGLKFCLACPGNVS